MPGFMPSFDELVTLAKHDPQEFELLRSKLCNQLINSAPESRRRRLKGLQFQIDMERRKATTPLAACIRISEMMRASFDELRYALNASTEGQPKPHINRAAARAKSFGKQDSGRIINFPGR